MSVRIVYVNLSLLCVNIYMPTMFALRFDTYIIAMLSIYLTIEAFLYFRFRAAKILLIKYFHCEIFATVATST